MRLGATDFARNDNKASRENRENFVQKCKAPANFGFTIIEVALVLAIAGLIFLVVFLALPALQKSQRDTARRQDVAKAVAALEQYFADGGSGDQATLTPDGGNIYDPAFYKPVGGYGLPIDPYLKGAGLSSNIQHEYIRPNDGVAYPIMGTIELWPAHKCGDKTSGGYSMTPATAYDIAVAVRLETGETRNGVSDGSNVYCATASR